MIYVLVYSLKNIFFELWCLLNFFNIFLGKSKQDGNAIKIFLIKKWSF